MDGYVMVRVPVKSARILDDVLEELQRNPRGETPGMEMLTVAAFRTDLKTRLDIDYPGWDQ